MFKQKWKSIGDDKLKNKASYQVDKSNLLKKGSDGPGFGIAYSHASLKSEKLPNAQIGRQLPWYE